MAFHRSLRRGVISSRRAIETGQELKSLIIKLPPENGTREAYIHHFMHTLQRRAFCLINVPGMIPNRVSVKRLRQDLGLQLDGDLRIVLAEADKLKPGMYQFVLGDRKYDGEYLPNMADVL